MKVELVYAFIEDASHTETTTIEASSFDEAITTFRNGFDVDDRDRLLIYSYFDVTYKQSTAA